MARPQRYYIHIEAYVGGNRVFYGVINFKRRPDLFQVVGNLKAQGYLPPNEGLSLTINGTTFVDKGTLLNSNDKVVVTVVNKEGVR
jgi:hypothetical protein